MKTYEGVEVDPFKYHHPISLAFVPSDPFQRSFPTKIRYTILVFPTVIYAYSIERSQIPSSQPY
jgi:hypothetical protein